MASGLKIKTDTNHMGLRSGAAILLLMLLSLITFYGFRWYNTGELAPFPLPVAAAGPIMDERAVTQEQIASFKADPSHPRYLSVPVLGIEHARVIGMDVDDKNALQMPENINDVGWYTKSALPGGDTGAVLLNGRSAGQHAPGVFAQADSLQAEDIITLERGDGTIVNYAVFDVRSMPVAEVYKSGMKEMMLSAESDKEGLSIVIASGNWVPKIKEYDRRIMVRAVRSE